MTALFMGISKSVLERQHTTVQNAAPTVHSFLVILAGFVTIAVLIWLATALLRRFAPDLEGGSLTLSAMSVQIGLGLAFSCAGGYVTALLARRDNPLVHSLVLALVVLLLSAISGLLQRGRHPVLYMLALVALPPLAVLAGGLLRLYQMGARW